MFYINVLQKKFIVVMSLSDLHVIFRVFIVRFR